MSTNGSRWCLEKWSSSKVSEVGREHVLSLACQDTNNQPQRVLVFASSRASLYVVHPLDLDHDFPATSAAIDAAHRGAPGAAFSDAVRDRAAHSPLRVRSQTVPLVQPPSAALRSPSRSKAHTSAPVPPSSRLTLCRMWVAVHELVELPPELMPHLTSLLITYVVFGRRHVIRLNGEAMRKAKEKRNTKRSKSSRARAKGGSGVCGSSSTNEVDADVLPIKKQHLFNFIAPSTPCCDEDGTYNGTASSMNENGNSGGGGGGGAGARAGAGAGNSAVNGGGVPSLALSTFAQFIKEVMLY